MICKSMYILKVYSIHWKMLKKIFLRTKSTVQKVPSFFFRELQLVIDLLLICNSYLSQSTRLVSRKLCVGFFNLILFRFYDDVILTEVSNVSIGHRPKISYHHVMMNYSSLERWFYSGYVSFRNHMPKTNSSFRKLV